MKKHLCFVAAAVAAMAGAACHSDDRDRRADNDNRNRGHIDREGVYSDNVKRDNVNRDNVNRDGRQGSNWQSSEDAKVLSILHCANQEEIKMGKMAQQNGASDGTRRFGEQLVRDHQANDRRVVETARAANITLMPADEVKRMMMREKGMSDQNIPDHTAEMRNMNGSGFDNHFATTSHQCHSDLIQALEQARPNLKDARVRALVDDTLPTLRKHREMAMQMNP